jgi:hypothetical protein
MLDNSGPRQGSEVVYEDLTQLCIWRDFPEKWWKYTEAFATCKGENPKDCEEKSFSSAGFDESSRDKLDSCLDSSFVAEGNKPINIKLNDNTILNSERSYQVENNIQHFPSLAINHALFSVKNNFNRLKK